MKESYPSFDDVRRVHEQYMEMSLNYWYSHSLFSFQWWLLLTILVVPWIIWWRIVDKKRLPEITLFGSILMVMVLIMDNTGVALHLWSYPYQLVQIVPSLIAIDMGILIIAHMLVFQFFAKWKSFIIANTIMGTVFAFICEPITVWLGIYKLENWEYVYSIPIYIAKAVLLKAVVHAIWRKSKEASKAEGDVTK